MAHGVGPLSRADRMAYTARHSSGDALHLRILWNSYRLQLLLASRTLDLCIEPKKPKDAEVCKKFLRAEATAYNAKTRPEKRVKAYEIQVWLWDFRSNPGDPNYGNMTKRFIFELSERAQLGRLDLFTRAVHCVELR